MGERLELKLVFWYSKIGNGRTLSTTDQPCVHDGLKEKKCTEASRDPLVMRV